MKKWMGVVLVLAFIFQFAAGAALASGDSWYCDTCGAYRDTEFCPICGAERPYTGPANWICPTCGKTWSVEYNFCPDDRTAKVMTTGSWPVKTLNRMFTEFRYPKSGGNRHQAFLGPGNHYPGAGAYLMSEPISIEAFFNESPFVYVDLTTRSGVRRCVYFYKSSVTKYPSNELDRTTYPARTTTQMQPSYGPGNEYDKVVEKTKNTAGKTIIQDIYIPANTDVNVFFETNGWVFGEFSCKLGLIRAWLPAGSVRGK